jgi:D-lactate dehydrogenase
MEPLACDVAPDAGAATEIGFEYATFDELLARSHFISINVPLTAETFHLFNRDTFSKCRPGVILINTARGRIIDSDALIEALDAGIVGGAGLDVLEDERVMRRNASHIISEQIIEHLSAAAFAPEEPLVQTADRAEELRQIMHNSDLLAHPNVVFTPHIAFNSVEAIERINRATADKIKAFFAVARRNAVLNRSAGQA